MSLSPLQKRWIVRVAKLVVLLLLAAGMHATLRQALADLGRPEFREHLAHIRVGWLVVAGTLYLAGTLPCAVFSHRLLVALRQPVTLAAVLRAWYLSQWGKYVPGKAMVVVLRTSMLGGAAIETTVVAASIFIDTLTTMACGALLATVVLAWKQALEKQTWILALGMFLVTGLPAIPAVFTWVIRLLGIGRINPQAADRLRGVPARVLVFGWLIIAGGWILQGLSLWAVLRALDAGQPTPLAELPLLTASAGLAVVAGFLTMIPGGFVGREFVLTELMAPAYGPALAALSSIVLRLVWIMAEAVVSCILYFSGPRAATPAEPQPTEPPRGAPG